jgi:hypothetical protein
MGIAVLSGVLDNLVSPLSRSSPSDEESAPSTPLGSMILDPKDNVPNKSVPHLTRASRELIRRWKVRGDGQ